MTYEPFSPLASEDARWDAQDAYESDQMADLTTATPMATRDLLARLASHGIYGSVVGTGGGCKAIEIPLSARNEAGFQDEILITAREDATLPYLGSGFGATLYRIEDEGDPYRDDDPRVIEAADPITMTTLLLEAIAEHRADRNGDAS